MAVSTSVSGSPEVHYRIGFVIGAFLMGGAVALDFLGFLFMLTGVGEVVTEIIGVLGSVGFFILFFFLGAGFFSKKKMQKVGVAVTGSIIEMIPFLNGLSPTFTIETFVLIYLMRKEDKEDAQKKSKALLQAQAGQSKSQEAYQSAVMRRTQLQRQAANNNEVSLQSENDNEPQAQERRAS